MKVTVLSRKEAVRYCHKPHDGKAIMISISDPYMTYTASPFTSRENGIAGILRLSFADADHPGPDVYGRQADTWDLMQETDGMRIARFLSIHPGTDVIIHCDAGISRSSGVAAAILKFYTGNDTAIFNDPRLSFGISTVRTGSGSYSPAMMAFRISSPWSLRYCRSSSTLIPSPPPAPLFLFTRLYARLRFSRLTILSRSPSARLSASVVLFSVIRPSISAPASSSCSALSLRRQPLPLLCFVLSFLSTSVTFIYLPPPRIPPFPAPSTAPVLWILLTSCGKSCFIHVSYFFSNSPCPQDLPGYHTPLSLHIPAVSTPNDSVQLLGFDLFGSLTLV